MMPKVDEEKLQYWQLIFEEQKQSGLSVTEFCKQRSIVPSRYYYYQELIYHPERLKLKQDQKKKQSKAQLLPVKVSTSDIKTDNSIKLILPNSMQCIMPSDMDIVKVKALVTALMSC